MKLGTNYIKKDLESKLKLGKLNIGKKQTFQKPKDNIRTKVSIACPICKEEYMKTDLYDQQLHEFIKDGKDIFAQCETCSKENKKPYVFQIIEEEKIEEKRSERRKAYRKETKLYGKANFLSDNKNKPSFNIQIKDISMGGLQLETLLPLDSNIKLLGGYIGIEFLLDDVPRSPIREEGKICYVKKEGIKNIMGISFTDQHAYRKAIGFYLKKW